VAFEGREQSEEDGEREFKHLGEVGDAILGECDTEILLHTSDEDIIGAEDWARVLDNGEEEFQREKLGT